MYTGFSHVHLASVLAIRKASVVAAFESGILDPQLCWISAKVV